MNNYIEVRPTAEECEEFLNWNREHVKAYETSVRAGTFLRRCNLRKFEALRSEMAPIYKCCGCGMRYFKAEDAAKCCSFMRKNSGCASKITLYTCTSSMAIVLKGCLYMRDTFKSNPNLMSIKIEDSGLKFDRDQFKL